MNRKWIDAALPFVIGLIAMGSTTISIVAHTPV